MQKIQIIGNVGNDAKIVTGNGSEFISFSVAVTERYTDRNGIATEQTSWYNCAYQTKTNEVAKFLTKGKKVFVEGKPRAKAYLKNGEAIPDVGINVMALILLTPKDADQQRQPYETNKQHEERVAVNNTTQPPLPKPMPNTDENDNDLPF